VISSLAKRLEKPPFCHSYTSFGVRPKDHYMPLQRSTIGVRHALLQFPTQAPLAVLRIPNTLPLLHQVVHTIHTVYHADLCQSPLNEHDTLPTAFLISKQVVPYRTHGGTWSLAVLSTTCHDGMNHLHPSNHCSNHNIDPHMAKSHHDGWKTKLSHTHTSQNSSSQRM
jgi:hypothetical protein